MKSIVLLCVIVTVVSAVEQVKFKLNPDRLKAVINNFATPCAKNGADVNTLVSQLADAKLPRDDATNEFLLCFTQKAGYIDHEGHIIVDGIAGILGDHPLAEQMKESLRKCNEITKENPVQTVVAMNDCIATNAPVRFVFSV